VHDTVLVAPADGQAANRAVALIGFEALTPLNATGCYVGAPEGFVVPARLALKLGASQRIPRRFARGRIRRDIPNHTQWADIYII
jgi:hypothetical protein